MEWKVTRTIPEAAVVNALIGAWEGGSNYWATAEGQPYRAGDDGRLYLPVTVTSKDGPPLVTTDAIDFTLDDAAIGHGLQVMAEKFPRQFADEFPSEEGDYNGDASTADIFLQCCLFGDVIFG